MENHFDQLVLSFTDSALDAARSMDQIYILDCAVTFLLHISQRQSPD